MNQVLALVVDVPEDRFAAAVAFWAAALSAAPEASPAGTSGDAPYVQLLGATAAIDVVVQRTGGPTRFHLDVAAPDRDAALATADRAGATLVERFEDWDVLEDAAGLPFCAGFPDPGPPRVAARAGARGYLDAVFVDVPDHLVAAELATWSQLLSAEVAPADGSPYTALIGVQTASGAPLTVEVQATPADPARDGVAVAPRMHIDLSSTDVAGEVDRLVALGARHVAAFDDWVTLADPAGNLFCVVPAGGDG